MKRNLLILGSIAIISILLMARLVFVHKNKLGDEEKWFAKSLRYEFSATIDSIFMYNQHGGRILARVTDGHPQFYREDSLKNHFEQHEVMYFVYRHSGDSITFILQFANQLNKGDSVRISSSADQVTVFRAGQTVAQEPFSRSIVGYGNSPFKRKE